MENRVYGIEKVDGEFWAFEAAPGLGHNYTREQAERIANARNAFAREQAAEQAAEDAATLAMVAQLEADRAVIEFACNL